MDYYADNDKYIDQILYDIINENINNILKIILISLYI